MISEAALYKEADFTYNDIKNLPEYRDMLNKGFKNISSDRQINNMNLVFEDFFEPGLMWQTSLSGDIRNKRPDSDRWGRAYQLKQPLSQREGKSPITLDEYNYLLSIVKEKSENNKNKFEKKKEKILNLSHPIIQKFFEDANIQSLIKRSMSSDVYSQHPDKVYFILKDRLSFFK